MSAFHYPNHPEASPSMRNPGWLLPVCLFLAGCAAQPPHEARIRLGLLPVLDALPIYVAEAEGYFAEEGLQVELIPVGSAPERDQLMQAGQIDAMVNEIVSTLFYNQDVVRIVIVRFARTATAQDPLFRILSAPGSSIDSPADLAGIPIGISEGTVIEYVTERLLQHAGLSADSILGVAVPRIDSRMSLLQAGELQAATLPDPLASLAMAGGAQLVLDDTSFPQVSHSVISFRADLLRQEPEVVRAFLRAVERSVVAINQDRNGWKELLADRNLVPAPLLETYQLPTYPLAGVPSPQQFDDAVDWAVGKGLLRTSAEYADSVDGTFLP
jgi:NitT/TauT family transport system substrate-binding protein